MMPAGSVSIEPVDATWSPEKKIEQSAARLRKISLALREYVDKEGRFPASPGTLLSWRVKLLPYLGYTETYNKFRFDQPWDSAANIAAAKDAPEVYRSPFRSDGKTCFLAPRGDRTLFSEPAGLPPAKFTDKWDETIAILMVDNEHAINWAQLGDFEVESSGPPLGNLGQEQGGFLVAMASGNARWIGVGVRPQTLNALLSMSGNEAVDVSSDTKVPLEGLAGLSKLMPEPVAAGNAPPAPSPMQAAATDSDTPAGKNPPERVAALPTNVPKPDDTRRPVPDDEEVQRAKTLLKQVFKDELERTKRGDKTRSKHDLADELMKSASKLEDDAAAYYVLLQTSRDSAAEVGDFELAQKATDALISHYQVNEFDLRRRTVVEAGKSLMPYYLAQNEALRKQSAIVLRDALVNDNFAAAKEVYTVFAEATQRKVDRAGSRGQGTDRLELARLQAIQKEIEDMKRAYQVVPPALKTLSESPDDPAANYALGAYLCLVKFRWDRGAPVLAKGSNLRLKVLANEEIAGVFGPTGMVDLANEYWLQSEQESGLFKRGLQLRAVHWYRIAIPKLPAGFAKLQAERRSDEANKTYGEALVKEALTIMDSPTSSLQASN